MAMAAVGDGLYIIGGYNSKVHSKESYTFDGWVLHLAALCERTLRQVMSRRFLLLAPVCPAMPVRQALPELPASHAAPSILNCLLAGQGWLSFLTRHCSYRHSRQRGR